MRFYLGANEPTWIGRAPYPLMVSVRNRKKWGRRPALAPWVLDSGGFTQITQFGYYDMSPEEYIETAYELADRHEGLEWMAPQDWMCEPVAREKTGLDVDDHLERTVQNYLDLLDLDERGLVIPVLQGWELNDYLWCYGLYLDAGIDLTKEPIVGIGSVCRRQSTDEITEIFTKLHELGLSMHGFGVKVGGLARYGHLLESADSMAWSLWARHEGRNMCGREGHKRCESCYYWASMWYEKVTS